MAVYFYRQIPRCEKCGYELQYSNIPSQNGRMTFVLIPEINDKIQSCGRCGNKYESNCYSFDDLSIGQKVLYLMGFLILPDFDKIKDLHSKPDLVLNLLYFIFPIYWVFIIFFNVMLIFPLRIPSHIFKAIKYSKKYKKLSQSKHKIIEKKSIINNLLSSVFHIFSLLFIPLLAINQDILDFLPLIIIVWPILIFIFNILRKKFGWNF